MRTLHFYTVLTLVAGLNAWSYGSAVISIIGNSSTAQDMVIDSFENGDLSGWETEGSAFSAVNSNFMVFGKKAGGVQGTYLTVSGDGKTHEATGTIRSAEFVIQRKYINFLLGGDRTWPDELGAHLLVDGNVVRSAAGRYTIAAHTKDLYPTTWDVRDLQDRTACIELVDRVQNGTIEADAFSQSDERVAPSINALTRSNETFRPQFHYSPLHGWMGDPNGLFYYKGLWHLFCQYSDISNGPRTWGYATSSNLLYWMHKPLPLGKETPKDQYLSGGGAVDWNNDTGLKQGDHPPLLLFYTHAPYGGTEPNTPRMACSTDAGKTWQHWSGNPLFTTADLKDRDPKAFRYGQTGDWFLLYHLSSNNTRSNTRVGLYRSRNFRSWELVQSFQEFWECPDMYELAVDGNTNNTRWVVCEGSGAYLVGTFNGERFTAETPIIENNWGGNFYALQTFENAPDNRRIQLGWMSLGSPNDPGDPGMPFDHQMSFPNELTLRTTADGPRQFSWPAQEIEMLRQRETMLTNITVRGTSVVEGVQAELLDVRAVIDPGTAKRIGLILRDQKIIYDVEKGLLTTERSAQPAGWFGLLEPSNLKKNAERNAIPLKLKNGKLDLRVLLDRASIELYANEGEKFLAFACYPEPDATKLEIFAEDGTARIDTLTVWELKSAQDL